MEAEYYAASDCAKDIIWFRELINELGYQDVKHKPIVIYEDNKACISFSKNNTCHDRTLHIDLKAYALRDCVYEGVIELLHVSTDHQLSDMLTKSQTRILFDKHKNRIMSGECAPPKFTRGRVNVGMCSCVSCFVGGASMYVVPDCA